MLELGLLSSLLEQNLSVTHTRLPCEQGMKLCWSAADSLVSAFYLTPEEFPSI